MSGDIAKIRTALETRLLTLGWGASQTAFENVTFTPTTGVPFQEAYVVLAEPNTYGLNNAQERGFFQVTLKFPIGGGAGAAEARAKVITAGFALNTRLTSGGQLVKIVRAPQITRLGIEGDRDVTVIRARFSDR